jgi:hypothetical protein
MFNDLLSPKKKRPAQALLESRGVSLKMFAQSLGSLELEMFYTFIEENLADGDFQVLDAPMVVKSRLGAIEYPLVIKRGGRITAFLAWAEKWDGEITREMLTLFGLFKKKAHLDASFNVLTSFPAPPLIDYFAQDSPRSRFHLLNLVDAAVERRGGSKVNLFIENFHKAFGHHLELTLDSLKTLEITTAAHLKPMTAEIQYSEPVKATMFMIKGFMEHVFMSRAQCLYYDRAQKPVQGSLMEHSGAYFFLDCLGKANWEFSREGPVRLHHFVGEIVNTVENPSCLPGPDSFPFFHWVSGSMDTRSAKRDKKFQDEAAQIAEKRSGQLKANPLCASVHAARVFLCGGCQEYFHQEEDGEDFPVFSPGDVRQKAHYYASGGGKAGNGCPRCGEEGDPPLLTGAFFYRFLPDTGWDLCYRLEQSRDGRLVGAWSASSQEGDVRFLGHELSDDGFQSVTGRYISAASYWRSLFQRAKEFRRADMLAVEDYYYILVIPPVPADVRERQLTELMEPMKLSGRNFHKFSLPQMADSGILDVSQSFHQWLPDYSHMILNGSHKVEIFFDQERFREKFQKLIHDSGFYYDVGKDYVYTVKKGSLSARIDIMSRIPQIIHMGAIPSEFMCLKLGEAAGEIARLESFIQTIRQVAGEGTEIRHEGRDGSLHVGLAGAKKKIRLDAWSVINSLGLQGEGPEEEIRRLLKLPSGNPEVCHCGRKTYAVLKLRSEMWMERLKLSGEQLPVANRLGKDFAVFVRECPAGHQQLITRETMEKWGLSIAHLGEIHCRSIPRATFRVKVFTATRQGRPLMAAIGRDAATIGLQSAWVKSLIGEAPFILPARCRLLALCSKVLVIGLEDTPAGLMVDFAGELAALAPPEKWDMLHFSSEKGLPPRGAGKVIVESIEDF